MTTPWPYPRWVAHRGAGKLAPENTLAAFRLGASHGFRMFECDAKLSRDGVPFLMHDARLERTTDGQGMAGDFTWGELSRLDAGSWHSRSFAGEPLCTLAAAAHFCRANHLDLNIEIKPTPGAEEETGRVVAQHSLALWRNAPMQPLFTSFKPLALAGAKAVAPGIARGLLIDRWSDDTWHQLAELSCVALVCQQDLWDEASVRKAQAAGLRTLSYTVNDDWAAERLIRLGTDGVITDRVDFFSPSA